MKKKLIKAFILTIEKVNSVDEVLINTEYKIKGFTLSNLYCKYSLKYKVIAINILEKEYFELAELIDSKLYDISVTEIDVMLYNSKDV